MSISAQLNWGENCSFADFVALFFFAHVVRRLKLKQFSKFDSAQTALEEVSALVESKVSPMLANMLESLKDEKKASLVVADPKLGMSMAHDEDGGGGGHGWELG